MYFPPPGIGAGADAVILGELARISTKKERTIVFSVFPTMRQVGLVLGISRSANHKVCRLYAWLRFV